MFLLNKVIQFRAQSHPDQEKPFLEHLEDLRTMILKVVVTLVISMLGCFFFQKQLMEILRRPVDQVWVMQVKDKLPDAKEAGSYPLDVETWEKAKKVERAVSALPEGQRNGFYDALGDPAMVFHAKSVALLRAAQALPDEGRADYLAGCGASPELVGRVELLLKRQPSPELDARGNLKMMSALKPTETFMLSMKLSLFAGIVVAFPLLLYFILEFVLPGLHLHERKVLWPAMGFAFALFLGGVFFSYYVVLPRALEFFSSWSGGLGVENDWRIGEYISFATQFTLLFGVAFELPVVVMVLVKLGILDYEIMKGTRSYAIVAIFVAAAILTPTPDAFTLMLMALPMVVLYEICIWLAWLEMRKNRREEERSRLQATADAGYEGEHYRHPATEGVDASPELDVDGHGNGDLNESSRHE